MLTEKKKSLKTGEVHAVKMTGKRTKEDQDIKEKMTIEVKMKKKEGLEDGEIGKNVKWISGAHLEIGKIEMAIDVEVGIVI